MPYFFSFFFFFKYHTKVIPEIPKSAAKTPTLAVSPVLGWEDVFWEVAVVWLGVSEWDSSF